MTNQGIDESSRHRLIILACVADIRKYLRQSLFVIDLHEVQVLGPMLLLVIIGVDILGQTDCL